MNVDVGWMRVLVLQRAAKSLSVAPMLLRGLRARKIYELDDPQFALSIVRDGGADLVLTEFELREDRTGADFVREVRRGPRDTNPSLPIIMLIGAPSPRKIVTARDAGVTEISAIPISGRELELKIQSAVRRPRRFVATGGFIGPDRRRRMIEVPIDRRRKPFGVASAEQLEV